MRKEPGLACDKLIPECLSGKEPLAGAWLRARHPSPDFHGGPSTHDDAAHEPTIVVARWRCGSFDAAPGVIAHRMQLDARSKLWRVMLIVWKWWTCCAVGPSAGCSSSTCWRVTSFSGRNQTTSWRRSWCSSYLAGSASLSWRCVSASASTFW